jgi:TPR repeat protein
MRPVFQSVLAAAFLAMASVADAGPLEDGQAAYDRHDYAAALQVWQPLADHGDAKAQNKLAFMYFNGWGVEQDSAEAVKWFRKAADQGYAAAQSNLGAMYANGDGVPKDDAEAVKWLRKAADQGHAAAQNKLAAMYASGRGVQPDGAASPTPSVADVGTKPPSPITTLPSSAKGYSWWSGWDSYAECTDYYTKNPPIPSFPFYEHYTPEQYCQYYKEADARKKAEEDKARRERQQRLRTIWLSCRASSASEEQAAACYALATSR